jgi:hypothetical protein
MSVTAVPAPRTQAQAATTRGSALIKLSLTELRLLSRERVRMVLPVAIPLLLIIILGNVGSLRQPRAIYGGESFIDLYTTLQLLTLAGWAVALGLAAARFFRWE